MAPNSAEIAKVLQVVARQHGCSIETLKNPGRNSPKLLLARETAAVLLIRTACRRIEIIQDIVPLGTGPIRRAVAKVESREEGPLLTAYMRALEKLEPKETPTETLPDPIQPTASAIIEVVAREFEVSPQSFMGAISRAKKKVVRPERDIAVYFTLRLTRMVRAEVATLFGLSYHSIFHIEERVPARYLKIGHPLWNRASNISKKFGVELQSMIQ